MNGPIRIRRGFADGPHGQIHYRRAGQGAPILLFHASPASSKQLEPVMLALADRFDVIAPDTPGNGDSDAPALPGGRRPQMADYAANVLALMDALEVATSHLYGSHTGAAIAAETAILAPDRALSVVMDGVAAFTPEQQAEYLARYAPTFSPTLEGDYLQRAFMFCRDQYSFFPWYSRDAAHRRPTGLPSPQRLHELVLDVLKAPETYPWAYHAAFVYPTLERIRLITCPVLGLIGASDPLGDDTRRALALAPHGQCRETPAFGADGYGPAVAAVIKDFIGC
ncbi:alpha/beta hydrolase [Niveispirillum sp. BGYR6]|uniref:alpha/beta fold hydrolase n=1 Tax=Niveispirillum sp. BGYR6 TaxID=2971249 RepID=UPI0022B9BF3F|nr:alpha/beta hydrolase [Niveispirillum sp. BGYR6]MDG5497025.1 alpha/beta hydrolase [Niveispirillum sp. BGYR6]